MIACLVLAERIKTSSGVGEAAYIFMERTRTRGRVEETACVLQECLEPSSRVKLGAYVLMERTRTDGSVKVTDCVHRECFEPIRRVLDARLKVRKGTVTLGGVSTIAASVGFSTSRSGQRRERKAGEGDEKYWSCLS